VHEVLHRDRYRGVLVWNRTRKRDRDGSRRGSARDHAEWVRLDRPELRIVSEELWRAAHDQIARAAAASTFPPRVSRDPVYLLPGLARCVVCGGGMCVRTHGAGDRRRRYYACTSRFHRGISVCGNGLQFPMQELDRAVLERVTHLLSPDVVDDVLGGVRAHFERRQAIDPRTQLEAELADVEFEIERYLEAVRGAGEMAPLVRRLRDAEERRRRLQETLSAQPPAEALSRIDWLSRERAARQKLDTWRGLLGRHIVPSARPVLRELLEEPLQLTPFEDGKVRGYRFRARVKFGELLAGEVVPGMASPGGLEPPAYRLGGGRSIH
jgi:hypothetical protein